MAVPFSNTKLRVPRGFQSLLEGLAREVLRSQPDDIYSFGAEYFERLLKQREVGGEDPTAINAELEDRFYNNKAFEKPDVDSSDPQMQDAALAIQTKFRQYQAKKDVHQMKEEHAATKIQAGARGYKARREVKKMKEGKTESDIAPAESGSEEKIDIDLDDPETEKAAVKIQAGFKGFKARQEVQRIKTDQRALELDAIAKAEANIVIDLEDDDVQQAALVIQASFRGFVARNSVEGPREDTKAEEPEETTAEEAVEETVDTAEEKETEEVTEEAEQVAEEEAEQVAEEETEGVAAEEEEPEKEESEAAPEAADKEETADKEEEVIDIDLNDPKTEEAAVKIQASFKGFKARKEVKAMKEDPASDSKPEEKPEAKPEEEEVDIDLEDPDVAKAATNIQAAFRGHKARKDLKQKQDEDKKDGEEGGSGEATE